MPLINPTPWDWLKALLWWDIYSSLERKGAMSDNDDCDDLGCPICGAERRWTECENCVGEGGFHDCGEDCCPCLDKFEITEECSECHGEGGYLQCSALPHTDEQMEAWRNNNDHLYRG